MKPSVPVLADRAPALVSAGGERASCRFFEFFAAQIHKLNTCGKGGGVFET